MWKPFIKIIISSVGILSILALLFFFIVLEPEERDWKGQIKIGMIAPLSGSSQSGGLSMQRGAELAVTNINNNGGINGFQLQLVTIDDVSIPALAEKAAKELIFIESVEAIIGPFNSDSCIAIKGLINSCGIPLITPVAMSDQINLEDDFIFRNTLSVIESQRKVNSYSNFSRKEYFMLEGLGAKTLGILWQDDGWGYEMQQIVVDDLSHMEREDTLLFNKSFHLGQTDFSDYFTGQEEDFPDLIYVVSSGAESIELVKAAREAGFTGLFLGEGGFNYSEFEAELGPYADGCLFFTQWHPSFSTPMSDVFLKTYLAEYDDVPDMFAAMSYEAMYILKDSLLRTLHLIWRDNYKSLLRDDLAVVRSMDGITGRIRFDRNGQGDRPVFVMQKKWDGRRVQSFILYPTEYAQSNTRWNFDL